MSHPPQPDSINAQSRERLANLPPAPTFDGLTFGPAYLNNASLRFNNEGALSFSMLIPVETVDSALDLRNLIRNPMPIQVTLLPYAPWMEHQLSTNERILSLPA